MDDTADCGPLSFQGNILNNNLVTSDPFAINFMNSTAQPKQHPLKSLATYLELSIVSAVQTRAVTLPTNLGALARRDADGELVCPDTLSMLLDVSMKAVVDTKLAGSKESWSCGHSLKCF